MVKTIRILEKKQKRKVLVDGFVKNGLIKMVKLDIIVKVMFIVHQKGSLEKHPQHTKKYLKEN